MIFIGTTKTGDRIEYRDRKRGLWVLSVLSLRCRDWRLLP